MQRRSPPPANKRGRPLHGSAGQATAPPPGPELPARKASGGRAKGQGGRGKRPGEAGDPEKERRRREQEAERKRRRSEKEAERKRRRSEKEAERKRRRREKEAQRKRRHAERSAIRERRSGERKERHRVRVARRRARRLAFLLWLQAMLYRLRRLVWPEYTRRLPRGKAVLVLMLNIVPLPGLGTVLYGKWERGVMQFLLTFVFLLGWWWAIMDGVRIVHKAFSSKGPPAGRPHRPQAARGR